MVPPPVGYLKKIRGLCDEHDILLIFDEVITGFGRTGSAFAAIEFDVTPDLMTVAKGINGGTVPMGGVFVKETIQQSIFDNTPDNVPEFFHGNTYAGCPVAASAGLAALDIYEQEALFTCASGEKGKYWDIEAREVKAEGNRFTLNAEEALKLVDENTIGVVVIMGSTMEFVKFSHEFIQ